MISVTDDIKKAYDESTTQVDKIVLDGQEYRITNVEYYDDCYEEGNIFGTAIARCLEFEIENSVNLEGKEVQYYTGVIINGIIKWTDLGNFIIQSVEPNDTTNINKVTAMDYMLKTNIEYVSELNYNSLKITLLNVLEEACNKSGLILATKNFANSNFIVDSNQFEQGTLIRQVIQAVAQVSGSFAKIKSDNKLYLITPHQNCLTVGDVDTMTVEELNEIKVEKLFLDIKKVKELTKNDYKELVVKRNTHPINVVSLGMSDIEGENITLRDEKSIAKDGENVLLINDNPFAYTQQKREQLITALFSVVKGFAYTSFEISGQSKPYLEVGDEVIFIDKDGNLYNSFLFRFNHKSPNGLESKMSAPSLTKATVNYQNVPDALDIAKRTEIKVNKQEQKINATVEKTDENTKKISDLEITVNGISQKVENIADLTKTITGIKTIEIEDAVQGSPIELKILGNNTVFDSLRLSDDVYLSDDTVLYGDSDIDINGQIYDLYVDEVLRQYEGIYDEYVYNYTENTSKIIRRIGVDDSGELYILENEIIENLTVPNLELKEGKNTISIPNYTANISITYVAKNDFTNTLATKAIMKSSITETAQQITSEVSENYTTKDETKELSSTFSQRSDSIEAKLHDKELTTEAIIGLINNRDGTSTALIKATNINLEGFVTLLDLLGAGKTQINGANITTGTISSNRLDTSKINAKDGTIGGFNINSNSLQSNSAGFTSNELVAFWAGTSQTDLYAGHHPFEATWNGAVYGLNGFYTWLNNHHVPLIPTLSDSFDGTGVQINRIYRNENTYIFTFEVANSGTWSIQMNPPSDKKLKKNIKNTNISALDVINKMRFVQFDWQKEKYNRLGFSLNNDELHEEFGLIADELEKVNKKFVYENKQKDGTTLKSVNRQELIYYNSKSIQELDKKASKLESEACELKKENTSLKLMIDNLTKRIEKLENKEVK